MVSGVLHASEETHSLDSGWWMIILDVPCCSVDLTCRYSCPHWSKKALISTRCLSSTSLDYYQRCQGSDGTTSLTSLHIILRRSFSHHPSRLMSFETLSMGFRTHDDVQSKGKKQVKRSRGSTGCAYLPLTVLGLLPLLLLTGSRHYGQRRGVWSKPNSAPEGSGRHTKNHLR